MIKTLREANIVALNKNSYTRTDKTMNPRTQMHTLALTKKESKFTESNMKLTTAY